MPRRPDPPLGGILRVRAFDARHQPLDLDAPDDWDDDTTVYYIPAAAALRFMHATRRGLLLGGDNSRLIAYWIVEPAGAPPRVYVTRYGRSCGGTVSAIPVRASAPEMLPDLPRERGVDCGCGRCKQHRTVHLMYSGKGFGDSIRKASA
jgi:hypothetical protein